VVLFVNGKGKRLGDLAAGTIVVKDSDYLMLWQLPGGRPPAANPISTSAIHAPPTAPFAPATPAEMQLRRLDPELRRFVTSYARRRPDLPPYLRAQLAGLVQTNLQSALPDVFAENGPLAALDHLADLERL